MSRMAFASGNPLADRRADYAAQLLEAGDGRAACDLMEQALELEPVWAAGWFRLGEMREAAGSVRSAIDAWRETLRLDPEDRLGAALKLELAGVSSNGAAMPQAFVAALYDQYAAKFEASLVGKLGYCVPDFLLAAIAATGRTQFGKAVDLGCGTGLMGERLRGLVTHLTGYDLSAEMLRQARAKGIYDELLQADIGSVHLISDTGIDLVTATDVFIYFGDLSDIFGRVKAALMPGGLFAFSVEELDAASGFSLRETRRYSHSRSYVDRIISEHGFRDLSTTALTIRMDRDQPVLGLACVVVKPQ